MAAEPDPGNKSAPAYPQRIRLRLLIGKMMGIFLTKLKKRVNVDIFPLPFVDVKIANLCISVRDGAGPFPFTDLHILPVKITFQRRKRSLGRPGLEPGTNALKGFFYTIPQSCHLLSCAYGALSRLFFCWKCDSRCVTVLSHAFS